MMKKITDLGANEVIHCPTAREAIAICQLMHDAGLRWSNGNVYKNRDNWDYYGKEACYNPASGTCSDIESYKRKGCAIYHASDFLPADFYKVDEAHSSVVVDPVRHDNGSDLIGASKRTARAAAIEYNEKARSMGKENDALQPEPKVGRLWECINAHFPSAFEDRFTVGRLYQETIGKPGQVNLIDDNGISRSFYQNGIKVNIQTYFRFHSDPTEKARPEPMSERKRKSFEFYDQLPEPLRTQAKENFDEDYSTVVPTDLEKAIRDGWLWDKSKHGDESSWALIHRNAVYGIYNQPAQVQPSPELLDAYNLLSSEGKKEMWQKHPTIKWPEVKEYVSHQDFRKTLWVDVASRSSYEVFVVTFKNCRPEIDEEKGEIRFVKIG